MTAMRYANTLSAQFCSAAEKKMYCVKHTRNNNNGCGYAMRRCDANWIEIDIWPFVTRNSQFAIRMCAQQYLLSLEFCTPPPPVLNSLSFGSAARIFSVDEFLMLFRNSNQTILRLCEADAQTHRSTTHPQTHIYFAKSWRIVVGGELSVCALARDFFFFFDEFGRASMQPTKQSDGHKLKKKISRKKKWKIESVLRESTHAGRSKRKICNQSKLSEQQQQLFTASVAKRRIQSLHFCCP